MNPLIWIALALVVLWLVVKFVFKVVGGMVHIILLIAVIAFIVSMLR